MKRLLHKTGTALRQVRHSRVRARVMGTATCPRLSVFRSNKQMFVQLVDDGAGKTLASVSTRDIKDAKAEGKTKKVGAAFMAGTQIATLAKAAGITTVVFDRGGYRYHGRVAAVAEGAREAGLSF